MDTAIGKIGFARIAPAVAIDADTPHTDIPEDKTAEASRGSLKTRLASV